MIESETVTVIDPVSYLLKQVPVTPVPELIELVERISTILGQLRAVEATAILSDSPIGVTFRRTLEDAFRQACADLESKAPAIEGNAWRIFCRTLFGPPPHEDPQEPTTPELVELQQALNRMMELLPPSAAESEQDVR